MVRKICFAIMTICLAAVSVLTAFADDYDVHNIPGSWKLDRVYENASSEAPVELDPEGAASLYSEKNDIYTFISDHNVFTVNIYDGADSFKRIGSWEKNGDEYTLRYDNGEESVYSFDSEQGELHRYWNITAEDAMYHDLDFVYTRVPAGIWMLKHVVSNEEGQDPVILDPESAASLYAEKNNLYYMNEDWSAAVLVGTENETFPVDDPDGKWSQNGESWLFDVDGYEMELFYDKEHNELHRYWTEDSADAMYHDLDFVYFRPAPM